MELRTTRNIFGINFYFAPSGLGARFAVYPRLTPWAAFLRRFAAGTRSTRGHLTREGIYRLSCAYNLLMARGWESKSVAQQQEEFASNKGMGDQPLNSQQIAAELERNGVELSRQRILQQLQVACNPRHRQMLETALAELDRKLRSSD